MSDNVTPPAPAPSARQQQATQPCDIPCGAKATQESQTDDQGRLAYSQPDRESLRLLQSLTPAQRTLTPADSVDLSQYDEGSNILRQHSKNEDATQYSEDTVVTPDQPSSLSESEELSESRSESDEKLPNPVEATESPTGGGTSAMVLTPSPNTFRNMSLCYADLLKGYEVIPGDRDDDHSDSIENGLPPHADHLKQCDLSRAEIDRADQHRDPNCKIDKINKDLPLLNGNTAAAAGQFGLTSTAFACSYIILLYIYIYIYINIHPFTHAFTHTYIHVQKLPVALSVLRSAGVFHDALPIRQYSICPDSISVTLG